MSTFPLGVMTVVTGVSGSGKSTLVNDILYRALAKSFTARAKRPARTRRSPERRTSTKSSASTSRRSAARRDRIPRPTPEYSPQIRDLYAMLPESRERGYKAGRFSFNVSGGRCEACQGEGQRRIEMNFLPDVYVFAKSAAAAATTTKRWR